ncbi:MAG TPA: hypothetical protein DCL69_01735 [Firmicutes bacterium]|nr:hypothetical protein [Bacillota bacterium]
MKVTCLAASNVRGRGPESTSTRVCRLVSELISERVGEKAQLEIVELSGYELQPCVMCGECADTVRCVYDSAFDEIFTKISQSDALFIAVPHYAPIPAKLMMLFEKFQEMAYLHYLTKRKGYPLVGKKVGIVAHGGQPESEETLAYYVDELLKPVANSLASVGMKITGASADWPLGIVFGIAGMIEPKGKLLPDFTHDWDQIKARVTPLAEAVLTSL